MATETADAGAYERDELIALCEAAIVPMLVWHDRDSAAAHEQVGRAWVLLRAGAPFAVSTTAPCVTNTETIWITITWTGFKAFESGDEYLDHETFYIPTRSRLESTAGHDWY